MSDLISRQDFDKWLEDAEKESVKNRKYVFASALNVIRGNLRNFPSAEPYKKGEPMSDLISRADAISVLEIFTQTDNLGHTPKQIVEALPSAEPKKGHWIGVDDEPYDVYECDRCGTTYDTVDSTWDLPNYCPNCGADMRGEEDERH